MTTEYITLKVGDTFQVGDQIYIKSEGRYVTIDEQVAKYHFVVAYGSVCRRPVTWSVLNSDRREWEEKEKELTLEEELAEANYQVSRLLEENDRLKSLVDELGQRLQTSEERRLRLMHTDSVTAAVPETELERKAWEIYTKYEKIGVTQAFDAAAHFITARDRRREESGK